jgi:hypothetical protein
MTDKVYSHIGVATLKGKTKWRWSMGKVEARIKTLQKGGFEQIEFCALPMPMTKAQALSTDVASDLARRYSLELKDADSSSAEAA